MKKIFLSVAILGSMYSINAQNCGSVNKAMRMLTNNSIDEAKTLFEEAGKEIEAAEKNNAPLEAKCIAKYYYGAGSTALQVFLNTKTDDLATKVSLLDKSEKYLNDFFALDYEDKSLNSRAITDLEAVANHQKSIGVDYYNKQDYETALRLFEKTIANKAKLGVNHLDLHAYEAAMIAATKTGDFEKALQYNEVLIKNPQLKINKKVNNQEVNLVKKAEILHFMGEIESAISVLDSAGALFPESKTVMRKKVQIYTEIKDDDSALEVLEVLTKTEKDDDRLFVIMGRIYISKGFAEESYQAYKTALSINPKSSYAVYGMGSYYVNKANEFINSLNTVGNTESDKAAKEGALVERDKNLDKAIHYFNMYLELEPGDRATLNTLKKIYKLKGDDQKVEEINQKLLAE